MSSEMVLDEFEKDELIERRVSLGRQLATTYRWLSHAEAKTATIGMNTQSDGPEDIRLVSEVIERIGVELDAISTQLGGVPANSDKTELVEIKLPGDLEGVSFEQREAAMTAAAGALGGVLGISVSKSWVTYPGPGSVRLRLRLPGEAAERLVALYEGQDPALAYLDLESVWLITREEQYQAVQEWAEAGRGESLAGFDLRERALSDVDLRSADLMGADLRGADLSSADLVWADLRGADLRETDLHGANLIKAFLKDSKIDETSELEDKWRLVWDIVTQGGQGRTLSGVDLKLANLQGTDLRGANLRGANLFGADLSWADLRGADLREADLSRSDLCVLNLSQADLRGANLLAADLRQANLRETDLPEANLCGAYLEGTDLAWADLGGANLDGTYMYWPDLRGTNLRGVELRRTQIRNLKYDDNTKWPDGFDPEQARAKKAKG